MTNKIRKEIKFDVCLVDKLEKKATENNCTINKLIIQIVEEWFFYQSMGYSIKSGLHICKSEASIVK